MSRIAVIFSTTRENRFADKPAKWVVDNLTHRDDVELDVVDLRDHPLPFYNSAVPPARAPRQYATPELAALGARIDAADAFIVLTAEYNHGYSGVLKNAMDWTFAEWKRKPITFVGWGQVGGARAIEQLRMVAVEFEMAPIRHGVNILPDLMVLARQAAEPFDIAVFEPLNDKLNLLVADLLWWAETLSAARTLA